MLDHKALRWQRALEEGRTTLDLISVKTAQGASLLSMYTQTMYTQIHPKNQNRATF